MYRLPFNIELLLWPLALLWLALQNPTEQHASLCMFKNIGWSFCPGCGLGHSISFLFRGEVVQSFHAHPLGIPAVLILLHRVYSLLRFQFSKPIHSIQTN